MTLVLDLEADDLATVARLSSAYGVTREELIRAALSSHELMMDAADLEDDLSAAIADQQEGRTRSLDEVHARLETKYRAMIGDARSA